MAERMVSLRPLPPSERLMTLAPASAAYTMPEATLEVDPEPLSSRTLTDRIMHSGQAPATPVPLFVAAAAMPAT